MATDPKDSKEAKDEKPREKVEELSEEQVENVSGGVPENYTGRRAQLERTEGWGRYATGRE